MMMTNNNIINNNNKNVRRFSFQDEIRIHIDSCRLRLRQPTKIIIMDNNNQQQKQQQTNIVGSKKKTYKDNNKDRNGFTNDSNGKLPLTSAYNRRKSYDQMNQSFYLHPRRRCSQILSTTTTTSINESKCSTPTIVESNRKQSISNSTSKILSTNSLQSKIQLNESINRWHQKRQMSRRNSNQTSTLNNATTTTTPLMTKTKRIGHHHHHDRSIVVDDGGESEFLIGQVTNNDNNNNNKEEEEKEEKLTRLTTTTNQSTKEEKKVEKAGQQQQQQQNPVLNDYQIDSTILPSSVLSSTKELMFNNEKIISNNRIDNNDNDRHISNITKSTINNIDFKHQSLLSSLSIETEKISGNNFVEETTSVLLNDNNKYCDKCRLCIDHQKHIDSYCCCCVKSNQNISNLKQNKFSLQNSSNKKRSIQKIIIPDDDDDDDDDDDQQSKRPKQLLLLKRSLSEGAIQREQQQVNNFLMKNDIKKQTILTTTKKKNLKDHKCV
ncbi:hypothetical protein DERP_006121 [Dermatophagoides pteronyssinus]|uniref:Uncharacterized protein n=1 Tax=Dermatophagoides pteronyssinus TaxID=6956 RepID=A0ABQ8JSD8_DERPT|nr:hypothetical protein DERP_006121 [Dermatophagoides pteronyssinus]